MCLPDNVHQLPPVGEATSGQLAVNHRPINSHLETMLSVYFFSLALAILALGAHLMSI